MKTIKPTRNSNFELLRIISMILIIIYHLSFNGNLFVYSQKIIELDNSFSIIFYKFIQLNSGWVGNYLFALISGFYLININFDYQKAFNICLKIFIILTSIYFVMILLSIFFQKYPIFSHYKFHLYNFSLHSPLNIGPWFLRSYVICILLLPLFNKVLLKASIYQFLSIILCLYFLYTFLEIKIIDRRTYLLLAGICTGGFLAKFQIKLSILKALKYLLLLFICEIIVLYYADFIAPNFQSYNAVFPHEGIAPFLASIFIFLLFQNFNFNSKIINFIATSSLTIYVLHQHFFNIVLDKLNKIQTIKHYFKDTSGVFFPLQLFKYAILIFIACFVIEIIRLCFVKIVYKVFFPKF